MQNLEFALTLLEFAELRGGPHGHAARAALPRLLEQRLELRLELRLRDPARSPGHITLSEARSLLDQRRF